MRLLSLLARQKIYFWSLAAFIGLAFALLVAGISVILLSQIFFLGAVPVKLLVLTASIFVGVSVLVVFVFYKGFCPFLPCAAEAGSDAVVIKNHTSNELRVALESAELMRRYKARQGNSYIYTLRSLQTARSQKVEAQGEVSEKIDPQEAFLQHRDLPLMKKIEFSGIHVANDSGKNLWIVPCRSYAVLFSAPRKQDKQGLILRPVWKMLRKLATELHDEGMTTFGEER